MSTLAEDIESVSENGQVVLAFCDSRYSEVLDNWLHFINKCEIKNYIVIALDDELYEALYKANISARIGPPLADLEALWIYRVTLILEILELGYDVVHSDVDAIWLQDPRPFLHSTDGDLIFSQGTVWPEEVHKIWGFVLCCGFFLLRSNHKSILFCNQWVTALKSDCDDQRALNRLLVDQNIVWQHGDSYPLFFREFLIECYTSSLTGHTDQISLSMLPHSLFQRLPDSVTSPLVRHPVSSKTELSTTDVLKAVGCWESDEQWTFSKQ